MMNRKEANGWRKLLLTLCLTLLALTITGTAHGAGELITNGDFETGFTPDGSGDSLPDGWMKREGRNPPETSILGSSALNGPSQPGSSSLHWVRTGGNGSGDWSAVWQDLDIAASDYAALQLTVDAMVTYHDLEAGGWGVPSFEWPVVVEIEYTLASDPMQTQIWRHGWYVDPPGDSSIGPVNDPGEGLIAVFNDLQVPVDTWTITTFDLFQELPDLGVITRIVVGGSGWDFEGRIDNVEITGRATWKAPYPNYAPSGMPDFDQRQDRWAHEILCGDDLFAESVADAGSDDVQVRTPGPGCTSPDDVVVAKGADRIMQTVALGDDVYRWDWCVPTAIANCLWWFDSKYADPEGLYCDGIDTYNLVTSYPGVLDDHCIENVDDPLTSPGGGFGELVEDLAWRMDTDGQREVGDPHDAGTTAADALSAVQQFLEERGLSEEYLVNLVKAPGYDWIAQEVGRSQDLILFLAFSEYCGGEWRYIGGHAVTVAGVLPDSSSPICISDPFYDVAELGGEGRVLPEGVSHGHLGGAETEHNDASMVSHDCYAWTSGSSPYGVVDLAGYARTSPTEDTTCDDIGNFTGQNIWDPDDPLFDPYACDPVCHPVLTHVAYALEISPFMWKAGGWEDYAPSGVPDFDQRLEYLRCDDRWSHCGPTAVADSFWWFDSKFEPSPVAPPAINDNYPLVESTNPAIDDHDAGNVLPLIEDLALRMNTDNSPGLEPCGTLATEMTTGIEQWLLEKGLDSDYYVRLLEEPGYGVVAEEVEKSQDIILLLGFWEDQGGTYARVGGHYVTVAGVEQPEKLIAFSDPYRDAAEDGDSGGRVLGEQPHGHPPYSIPFDYPGMYHIISLPRVIIDPPIFDSDDLFDALFAAGLDPVSVERWDTTQDNWFGGSFPIDPAQAYRVLVGNSGQLVLDGVNSTSPVWLAGPGMGGSVSGTHFISLPFDTPLADASELLTDIGPMAVSVSRYDPVTMSFQIYFGSGGVNFPITSGEGYSVQMISDTLYTPPAPPAHADTLNVSHDMYEAVPTSAPGGSWSPEGYADSLGLAGLDNFQCQNRVDAAQDCALYLGGPVETVVERAIEVSPCPVDADGDTFRAFCDGDCDDDDPFTYPGAPQVCDGVNNDCDSSFPDPTWPDPLPDDTDADGDGFSEICGNDCDDSDPATYPGAPQICDGVNNDCDSSLPDPPWPTVPPDEIDNDMDGVPGGCGADCDDFDPEEFPGQLWYADCDGDSFQRKTPVEGCDVADANLLTPCLDGLPPDGGWSHSEGDECDDENPLKFPALHYADCDGDGFARPAPVLNCDPAELDAATPCLDGLPPDGGWSGTEGADCNDENPGVGPGMPEIAGDGTDQNCDGGDDCYQDLDGDDYGTSIVVTDNDLDCTNDSMPFTAAIDGDCDDGDASINPGMPEVVGDGTDQDCDGFDDCYQDLDDDGYGTSIVVADNDLDCTNTSTAHTAAVDGDCDDGDPSIHAGADEVVGDGIDQDCDNFDDCYEDLDDDGYGSSTVVNDNDLDCANSSTAHTAAVDGDCDDNDPSEFPDQVWYADCDNDTHARADVVTACDAAEAETATPCADLSPPDGGWSHTAGADCDDEDASVYPSAAEIIGDGIDQDCDGVDECYEDLDDDGYGTSTVVVDNDLDCTNSSTTHTAAVSGDCDDAAPTVYPGAEQLCGDSLNNDCDHPNWGSLVGTNEYDDDGDTYTECAGDCDDGAPTVYPGAEQLCGDGLNNDCYHPNWGSLVGTNEYDDDGDTRTECAGDCDDGNGQVWGTPGEVRDLLFLDKDTLGWTEPLEPGGTLPLYDTLSSGESDGFLYAGVCVESDDGSDTLAIDSSTPAPGQVEYYLVRADNACPIGQGTLGEDSVGNERAGRGCPDEIEDCTDGVDNDGNGEIDCCDSYCDGHPNCTPTSCPTDDANVDQYQPNVKRGLGATISLRNDGGSHWGWDGLVRFDLSHIPDTATVTSATLHLYYWRYKDHNPSGRTLRCFRLTESWDEATVTWNNRPAHVATPISETDVPSSYGWMSWDVTDDVSDMVAGTVENFGWKIRDETLYSGSGIPITRFRAKEYGSNIPYLTVEYVE